MVGMHVGIDDVIDGDARFLCFLDVPLLITRDHIHSHGFSLGAAAEEIG
jgi:hypothetical protein